MINARLAIALGVSIFCQPALAQDALTVCKTLVNDRLIDTKINSETYAIAKSEFDLFCSDEQNLESNMHSKDRSFSGSFAYGVAELDIGSTSSSDSLLTQGNIKKVCDEGYDKFVSHYTRSLQQSEGSPLARVISECVNNVLSSAEDHIWGTIELLEDGRNMIATIERKADNSHPKLFFAGMNPTSRFSNCRVGTSNAMGKQLVKLFSLSCEVNLNQGETEGAKSIQGSVIFRADNNDFPHVTFKSIRSDVVAEFKNGIYAELNGKLASLEGELVKKADQSAVNESVTALAMDVAVKLRPVAEQYTIWSDVPDPTLTSRSEGPGHKITSKPLMPENEGLCAINQIGTRSIGGGFGSGLGRSEVTVDRKAGFWNLTVYTGAGSPNAWFVGATCWRYR